MIQLPSWGEVWNGIPKLEGAKASAFDDRYNLNNQEEEDQYDKDVFVTSTSESEVDASITTGDAYTYKLFINTTLALEISSDGSPVICHR